MEIKFLKPLFLLHFFLFLNAFQIFSPSHLLKAREEENSHSFFNIKTQNNQATKVSEKSQERKRQQFVQSKKKRIPLRKQKIRKRTQLTDPHRKTHLLTQPEKKPPEYLTYGFSFINENFFSFNFFKLQTKSLVNHSNSSNQEDSITVEKIHLNQSSVISNYKFSHSFLFLFPLVMNHSLGLEIHYDYEGSKLKNLFKNDNQMQFKSFERYQQFNYLFSNSQYEASQLNTLLTYRAYSKVVENHFFIHYGLSSYIPGVLNKRKSNHLIYSLMSETILLRPDLNFYGGLFFPTHKNRLFWILFNFGYFFNRKDEYNLTKNTKSQDESEGDSSFQRDYVFYDQFQSEPKYEFKMGYEFKWRSAILRTYFKYLLLGEAFFTHARNNREGIVDKDLKLEYKNFTRLGFHRKTSHNFCLGLDFSFYLSTIFTSLKLKYYLPGTTKMSMNVFVDPINENYKASDLTIRNKGHYSLSLLFIF